MSGLVGYSSGEEDDDKKQKDINYDNVNMDMSDEDEEDAGNAEEKMFSSKNEYLAFKNQFRGAKKEGGKGSRDVACNEYGSSMPEAKSKPRGHEEGKRPAEHGDTRHQESRKRSHDSDREPHRRSPNPDHHGGASSSHKGKEEVEHNRPKHDREDSDKHKRDRNQSRERNNPSSSKRGPREFERVSSRDDHRHHDKKPRDHGHNRRDNRPPRRRSKSPNNFRRGNEGRSNDGQERRAKKLESLGLVNPNAVGEGGPGLNTVEAQAAKVKELTGVEIPKYYNPTAINPLKYAEQIKKRKMLWSKKTSEPEPNKPEAKVECQQQSFNKWEQTNFGSSETNEKFRRLMGIKGGGAPAASCSSTGEAASTEKSASLFAMQEKEYEKARAVTHTMRGLGLGFAGGQPHAEQRPQNQHIHFK